MRTLMNIFTRCAMPIVTTAILMSACSSDEGNVETPKSVEKSNVQGTIEKGPFVQGSKVMLYELDANFGQTGKSFRTQTVSDLGAFSFDSPVQLSSQFVELETSGYFYNEVKGKLSASQITLNAISDVSNRSTVNVNLITHLEFERVKRLIREGKSFSAAKSQAEQELLKCFAITDRISSPEDVSITDNSKNSAILLAISTILLYDKSEAEFSEFIARLSTDFADNGKVDNELLLSTIAEGKKYAHPSEVIEKMKDFYEQKGVTLQCDDFSRFIDFNGDGVIDDNDEEEDDEIVPYVDPATESFRTEAGVREYLSTIYTQVAKFEAYQLILEAARIGRIDGTEYDIDLSDPSDATILQAWTTAYTAVRQINALNFGLRQYSTQIFNITPYMAEAQCLHAFIYYNLAVLWGNVPFIPFHYMQNYDTQIPQSDQRTILESISPEVEECLNSSKMSFPTYSSSEAPFHLASVKKACMLMAEIQLTLDYPYGADQWIDRIGSFESEERFLVANDITGLPSYYTTNATFYRQGGQPIYDSDYFQRLNDETIAFREHVNEPVVADHWYYAFNQYGIWAALKRMGWIQEFMECQSHELLLPIPTQELQTNPIMKQNPGY